MFYAKTEIYDSVLFFSSARKIELSQWLYVPCPKLKSNDFPNKTKPKKMVCHHHQYTIGIYRSLSLITNSILPFFCIAEKNASWNNSVLICTYGKCEQKRKRFLVGRGAAYRAEQNRSTPLKHNRISEWKF